MPETLRTTVVWDRAYDVTAHQQAAMPEQLPVPPDADLEDHEPEVRPREAIDMKALRALRKSRTDVEALDLTVERLRHRQGVFNKAADDSRTRVTRYAEPDDADAERLVRQDDQQAHHPQPPTSHRGREADY
ncbi:hypothetical protein [Streptomyces sp. NPDC058401]|uniref:hypothetical protein n=1 Tax=Streptomyces sp. NPDC058401 TaxID=3346480 RepID=UPI003654ADF9